LSQKTTTVAAQVKGALWTAIVVDNVNHKLFVADAGTGTIYSFGIDRSSQRLSSPIVFARNPKLRSLSGLAVRSNRTLLLADEDSKVIFVISKEGKFLSGI
jgi:hypothetical protein